jgi:hypothetical protein
MISSSMSAVSAASCVCTGGGIGAVLVPLVSCAKVGLHDNTPIDIAQTDAIALRILGRETFRTLGYQYEEDRSYRSHIPFGNFLNINKQNPDYATKITQFSKQ